MARFEQASAKVSSGNETVTIDYQHPVVDSVSDLRAFLSGDDGADYLGRAESVDEWLVSVINASLKTRAFTSARNEQLGQSVGMRDFSRLLKTVGGTAEQRALLDQFKAQLEKLASGENSE